MFLKITDCSLYFFGPEKWRKDAGQLALVVLVGLLGATAQASGASQGQDSLIIT